MVGEQEWTPSAQASAKGSAASTSQEVILQVDELSVNGDRGHLAVDQISLKVHAGEILGIAGVSGNGQRELIEALIGQRNRVAGTVRVLNEDYLATREQNHRLKVRSLPEEPLLNACVAHMSLAQNMALRDFDQQPMSRWALIKPKRWRLRAQQWISDYGIKAQSENALVSSLSGGNVQRTILARELHGQVRLLIVMNPVFGLDFAAVHEIHQRIRMVRQQGGAVLLISEDLDELLELSDRLLVMSTGQLVHETLTASAQKQLIGSYMAGESSQGGLHEVH
jgi:simple sugar transport system ATP-binding protein